MVGKPDWWISGKTGSLSPLAQSKVWALATLSKRHDLYMPDESIAEEVEKVGGGHPSKQAIGKLRRQFEEDADWYPGKIAECAQKRGPKGTFTAGKKQAVARSAMAMKARGQEPSVADVIRQCPQATFNPDTGKPYSDKAILRVFKTQCYDQNPDNPWVHVEPLQKTALTPTLKLSRWQWAEDVLAMDRPGSWFHRHCIWLDPCNTIISSGQRAAFDEQQANYGRGARWMSQDSRKYSRNLRASPYAGKQQRGGDKRLWWFVIFFRGHVHFEYMPDDWEQTGEGMALMVSRLPGILRSHLGVGVPLPRAVVSDRGPGFYQSNSGRIVHAYADALKSAGFRPFAGDDASKQPADVPDVMLHETIVGWVRACLKSHPPRRTHSVEQNEEALRRAMEECRVHIEANYDVDSLSQSFPDRLCDLAAAKGDRLAH